MKKVLSFVLVLSMVLGSVSMAFATTANTVSKVPTVAAEQDVITTLTLVVKDVAGVDASEQTIKISLENATWGSEVDSDVYPTVTTGAFGTDATATGSAVSIDSDAAGTLTTTGYAISDNSIEFGVAVTGGVAYDKYYLVNLNICAGEDAGEVKVKVDGLDSQISSGTYTVAVVGTDDSVAVVPGEPKVTGRTNVQAAEIEIRETAINSLYGPQLIKLTLPKGVTWDKANTTFDGNMTGTVTTTLGSVQVAGGSDRDLYVGFTADDLASRQVLVIKPAIKVGRDAKLGDIEVQVRNQLTASGTIDDANGLVIAKYAEENVLVYSVSEKDLPEIVAGRTAADFGADTYTVTVTLEESQANALVAGRYVDFEFPENVMLVNGSNVEVKANGGSYATIDTVADDETNTFEWLVAPTANWKAGKPNTITFRFTVTVDAATANSDLEVVVSGAKAGVDETKVVVAKIVAPITVEATLSDVKTGVQDQKLADITIKENFVGALFDTTGNNKVTLDLENMSFSKGYVEVVSGDLEVKEAADKNIEDGNGNLTFTIDRTSIKTPAEIKISGIEVTLNRTPAEGKYDLYVKGDALLNNAAYEDFSTETVATEYVNVVTPADQGVNATFKIGESKYTVNGVEVAMDAPSYVDDNNRTMVSIRYVANALGVSDNKIIWNEDAQTATIFGKSTVVVKIGENQITVNGSVIPMDTQAVNKAGRIYVPLRYIANALGAAVEWNQDAQTATIITLANN